MKLTYEKYLKIDELLSLQQPQSDEPAQSEMLFIIIHQTYELWFREILHEVDYLNLLLNSSETQNLIHTLKRIRTIIKVLEHQLDILETMTPKEFLSFRDKLQTASGFQSYQFRELEFVFGYKRESVLSIFDSNSDGYKRLKRRISKPSIWNNFITFLDSIGYAIPKELVNHTVTIPTESSPQIQQILLNLYEDNPHIREICEYLLDIDEGIQQWRYHHVKMVERVLGGRQGTGGSSGVEYLRSTLFKPFFPDLWAIRSTFGEIK